MHSEAAEASMAEERAQLGALIAGNIAGHVASPGRGRGPGDDPHWLAEWSSQVAEAILKRWGL